MSTRYLSWTLLFTAMTTSGCALLSKSEPFAPRYFSAEQAKTTTTERAASTEKGPQLRLGTTTSGSDIRANLVFRSSDVELGFYEDRRWTEKPEAYLRRALSRALFEQHGLQRVISGRATTLEVELIAFEELVGPPNLARASVVVILHDERSVLLERTMTVESPVGGVGPKDLDEGDAIVRALSVSLSAVVEQIAVAVTEQLRNQSNERPVANNVAN